jgi:predicted amidophosphoribosyltransferase
MTAILVRCRCGSTHLTLPEPAACRLCSTPTWDHHGVCARCRGHEAALDRHTGTRTLDDTPAAYICGDGSRRYDTG